MADRLEIGELVARLADRAPALARDLLPGGVRRGSEWCLESRDSPFGCSVSMRLGGAAAGRWGAWAAGKRGDALDLVAELRCAGDLKAAIPWALDWLGGVAPAWREEKRPRRPAKQSDKGPHRYGLGLWLSARRLSVPGDRHHPDPVWRYLKGRGIDLGRWKAPPGALRYHPSLEHKETGTRWPAMVAVICNAAGEHTAIHRTWLEVLEEYEPEEHPTGVRKAPLGKGAKMVLGSPRHGCIHLARGKSNRRWSEMPAGETLLLGEGIEDVLSAIGRYPDWRAAAGASLPYMLSLELPPQITTICFLRQRDPPGSPAHGQAQEVMERFVRQGRRVLEWQAPVFVKDINELDQKTSHHGAADYERRAGRQEA